MEIVYSPKFAREYRKLPQKVKSAAEKVEKLFRADPHDKRLGTHKLHGRLKEYWSFSIGFGYRIIFEFSKENNKKAVYFHSVGNHDIYQ